MKKRESSKQRKQKLPLSNILIFILVIVLFVGLFYMSSFFREKEENVRAENPIVFCQPPIAPPEQKECFFTTHIHYHLIAEIFGELKTLGFESGPLQSFHTHSQKNKFHWHAFLPADPETKEPKELPVLQDVFDAMNIPISKEEVYGHKIGENNPATGEPAALTIFVDGEKVDDPQNYVLDLKKEQTIKVVFT